VATNTTNALTGYVGDTILDLPNTAAAQAYTVKIKNNDNVTTMTYVPGGGASIVLTEIMG
jgi:hypothetical protein